MPRVSITVHPLLPAPRARQTLSSRPMLSSTRRPARTSMRALLAAGLLLAGPGCGGDPARPQDGVEAGFTIAAASSLAGVVEDLVADWVATGERPPRLTLGPSSTLARQLEEGAPFDLFLSADERWIDALTERGHLESDARVDLARGRLVLGVRSEGAGGPAVATAQPTAQPTDDAVFPPGRWATGDPAFVPLGEYAREALVACGAWPSLSARMIPAGSARAALRLLEIGEADWGVLYRSDAVGSESVQVLRELDGTLHHSIRYCGAATPSAGPGARRFLDRLAGGEAAASLAAHGFEPTRPAGEER